MILINTKLSLDYSVIQPCLVAKRDVKPLLFVVNPWEVISFLQVMKSKFELKEGKNAMKSGILKAALIFGLCLAHSHFQAKALIDVSMAWAIGVKPGFSASSKEIKKGQAHASPVDSKGD